MNQKFIRNIVLVFTSSLLSFGNLHAQNSKAKQPTLPAKSVFAPASAATSSKAAVSSASSSTATLEMPKATVEVPSSKTTTVLPAPKSQPSVSTNAASANSSSEAIVTPAELKAEDLEDQIKLLEELVNVSSDSKLEIEGVNKVQAVVERELKDLNFKVELIANPDPYSKSGSLLVATYPGKTEQFITIVTHADTVFPASVTKDTLFAKFTKSSDLEATGPGVIDNKGGIVVALGGIKNYLEANPSPVYSLRVIVSPSEEIGSTGFLEYFKLVSLTSVSVFGMEPALDQGDIVDSRRGDRWYDVTIRGREAHSGRAHDQGVNACQELALKIEKLQKLTNYKKEVTINVGAIQGGKDKYAIVCGEASMKLDIRFSDLKNRARVLKSVEDILKAQYVKAKSDGARAITEWKIVDDPQPYPAESSGKTLVEIYKKAVLENEGIKIASKRSGGSSDMNFFYRPGLIVLDGLGPVGAGMHTVAETIQLKTLQTRAIALSKLIQAAGL